jgi:hypothetical protein
MHAASSGCDRSSPGTAVANQPSNAWTAWALAAALPIGGKRCKALHPPNQARTARTANPTELSDSGQVPRRDNDNSCMRVAAPSSMAAMPLDKFLKLALGLALRSSRSEIMAGGPHDARLCRYWRVA